MKVFARSKRFIYIDVNGTVVSMYKDSEDFISNTFYSLPIVGNQDEAEELLDIINNSKLSEADYWDGDESDRFAQ